MGRTKLKAPQGSGVSSRDLEAEVEERCISIVANLFQVGVRVCVWVVGGGGHGHGSAPSA